MRPTRAGLVAGVTLTAFVPSRAAAATCESLLSLSVPHGAVTRAQAVGPGAFTPPNADWAGVVAAV